MNAIILAFTLKGQDQDKIIKRIESLGEVYAENICIHGFMPLATVIEKQFDPAIVYAIKKAFPVQLNMYDDVPLRTEMADVGKKLGAKVVVVGDIKEGVKEEVDLYKTHNLEIVHFPLY
jgi:hypothetical protein